MNFRINFSKFIDMLLPPMLRQVRQQEWLSVLSKPMDNIQQELVTIVDAAKKEVAYQPNKGLVEERLNEEFEQADKIWIINLATGRPYIYLGLHNVDNYRIYIGRHNEPTYQLYISQHDEYNYPDYDFDIVIDDVFAGTLSLDDINVIAVLAIRYSPDKRFRIRKESGYKLYPL
jgi:hypothetical protein